MLFEPKNALFGGEDGLDHIREIIYNAPFYLKDKGWLLIENHYGTPMDIEWAKDGIDGELYILQARPETVVSANEYHLDDYQIKSNHI
mgnify:CR=1 FL=1